MTGEKIFVFENVPLQKGENTIVARSGGSSDRMVLNRTDEPNEAYVLQVQGNEGKNWFEDIQTSGDLTFNEGYFSIKDKIGDIMKTPEGDKFISDMIEKVTEQMNMNVSKGMLNMAKGFTVEKIFGMAGGNLPDSVKVWVNDQLQQIKK